jgi:competence protein ComEA
LTFGLAEAILTSSPSTERTGRRINADGFRGHNLIDESHNVLPDDPTAESDVDSAVELNGDTESPEEQALRERRFLLTISTFFLLVLTWQYLSRVLDKPEPLSWEPGDSAKLFRVDVNAATWIEWSQLPGIGPSLAHRIVADREANGPFESIDRLQRVNGIGPMTLERIRPWLTLDKDPPPSSNSAMADREATLSGLDDPVGVEIEN